MAGRLHTKSRAVAAQLRRELEEILERAGERMLREAAQRISSNPGRPGDALGQGNREQDLANSGYLVTSKKNGYEAGKAGMVGGRDIKRGIVAEPATVNRGTNEVRVKVAYAAGRALLMHEGYVDAKSGNFMYGTPFLRDAAEEVAEEFFSEVGEAVGRLRNIVQIRPMRPDESFEQWMARLPAVERFAVRDAEIQAFQREADKIDREFRRDMQSAWRSFSPKEGMGRMRGRQIGMKVLERTERRKGSVRYKGTSVPLFQYESEAERLQRISDEFRAFFRAQNQMDSYYENYSSGDAAAGESGASSDYITDFVQGKLR